MPAPPAVTDTLAISFAWPTILEVGVERVALVRPHPRTVAAEDDGPASLPGSVRAGAVRWPDPCALRIAGRQVGAVAAEHVKRHAPVGDEGRPGRGGCNCAD